MKLYFKKLPGGTLVPADDEAVEWLQKIKAGDVISADVVRPRNYKFLAKYMVLLRLAFEAWEPAIAEFKGHPVVKNFHRFRKDIAIATGFYELTVNLKGETRAEAKSISFASMSEEEFDKLYQKTITLLLVKYQMLSGYKSAEEVDVVVNEILRFA